MELCFHDISRLPHLPNPAALEHRHDLHELVIVLHGSYAVRLGGKLLHGMVGDTFHFPPGLRHVPMTTDGGRSQLTMIRWSGETPQPQPRQVADHDGRLRSAAVWLWQLALGHPPPGQAVLDGLLLALLYERSQTLADPDGTDLFDQARRYLNANLGYALSLDELADAMGASPATLHRRFIDRTGMPPMRYRRQLRVEAVLALLQAGDDRPLAELASQFGFANASHLSRAVQSLSGRPPSAWRAR